MIPVGVDEQRNKLNNQDETQTLQQDHQTTIDDQQPKFILNVDSEKATQPLQLLFQLPNVTSAAAGGGSSGVPAGAVGVVKPSQHQQEPEAMVSQKKCVQHNQLTQTMNTMTDTQNCHQHLHPFQGLHQCQQNLQPNFTAGGDNGGQPQRQNTQHQVGTQTAHLVDNAFDIHASPFSKQVGNDNNCKSIKISMKKGDKRLKEKRYLARSNPSSKSCFSAEQKTPACSQVTANQVINSNKTIDVDSETDSNHDTALTLACAGGHEELVELLLARGANIEHRDKKGFTPLILAATAGHTKVVEILIREKADLEAQSERTKDTPLSLACSGGRYEVVELLLKSGANKEHRNVSDYTPLSLAASGGYVNIIKLLLNQGAEINSRTGSKLGISPLMLAAMNGHTTAVRLLLDMGSDINAQIETNRNTALTLACFQGRHEVVSLLLDRKANVEHRAKTGLTPLMEAASGGYIEVGRVLLDKGADVNAAPVPSSRDTALTIAADKGHLKFVELLLSRNAAVEVKNKKGNSPLWLAANGGHLNVIEVLYNAGADIDSQDNRKVSCLMAAFRKGHIKVIKWMVNHVSQFPSDQEMTRFISTIINDKDITDKCNECVKIIRAAKETQAKKAYINASILLRELDMEKSREEQRKAAAAKRRERKKRRKQEKREMQKKTENKTNVKDSSTAAAGTYKEESDDNDSDDSDEELEENENTVTELPKRVPSNQNDFRQEKEEGDSGIDANSQGSCSSSEVKANSNKIEPKLQNRKKMKEQQKSKAIMKPLTATTLTETSNIPARKLSKAITEKSKSLDAVKTESNRLAERENQPKPLYKQTIKPNKTQEPTQNENMKPTQDDVGYPVNKFHSNITKVSVEKDENELGTLTNYSKQKQNIPKPSPIDTLSPNKATASTTKNREEGWKEVIRKSSTQQSTSIELKKVQVPTNAISRVIGRGGSNINAIRSVTGAHIEVEKQGKVQSDRTITIKGSLEATKQAYHLITTLIRDADADIFQILAKEKLLKSPIATTIANTPIGSWEKPKNFNPTPADLDVTQHKKNINSVSFTATTKPQALSAKSSTSQRYFEPRNSHPSLSVISHAGVGDKKSNFANASSTYLNKHQAGPIQPSSVTSSHSAKSQENLISIMFPSQVSNAANSKLDENDKNDKKGETPNLSLYNPTSSYNASSMLGLQSADDLKLPPGSKQGGGYDDGKKMMKTNNNLPIISCFNENKPLISDISNVENHYVKNRNNLEQNNLNVSNKSMVTSQLQSKMKNTLHSNAQAQVNQVYSLFNDSFGSQWDHKQYLECSKANLFTEPDSMVKVDASKAPGYRGNIASSPINSKTINHPTTPPSNQIGQTTNSITMNNTATISLGVAGQPSPVRQMGNSNTRNTPGSDEQAASQNLNINNGNGGLILQQSLMAGNQYQLVQPMDMYGVSTTHLPSNPLVHDLASYDQYSHNQNVCGGGDGGVEPKIHPVVNSTSFNSRLNPTAASFSYLSTTHNSGYSIDSGAGAAVAASGAYASAPFYPNTTYNNKVMPGHGGNYNQTPIAVTCQQQQGSNSGVQWYQHIGNMNRNNSMNPDNSLVLGLNATNTSPTINANNPNVGCLDDARKIPRPIGVERNWKLANHFENFQQYHNMAPVPTIDNDNTTTNSTWSIEMTKSYPNQYSMPWAEISIDQRRYIDEMNQGLDQYQVRIHYSFPT